MGVIVGRFLLPMAAVFLFSWLTRAALRYYVRRRSIPPKPPGKSSAKVVEGSYRIKDEEEP